eukprot:1147912-Pelagomonas_calceolata.AAC.11
MASAQCDTRAFPVCGSTTDPPAVVGPGGAGLLTSSKPMRSPAVVVVAAGAGAGTGAGAGAGKGAGACSTHS